MILLSFSLNKPTAGEASAVKLNRRRGVWSFRRTFFWRARQVFLFPTGTAFLGMEGLPPALLSCSQTLAWPTNSMKIPWAVFEGWAPNGFVAGVSWDSYHSHVQPLLLLIFLLFKSVVCLLIPAMVALLTFCLPWVLPHPAYSQILKQMWTSSVLGRAHLLLEFH